MHDRRRGCGAWRPLLWSAVLIVGVSGCESLQRKLTRRSKQPKPPPTPIVNFQDYSQATTPVDRYRKHYLIFDYWNEDLLQALDRQPVNPKRVQRASSESLVELDAMKSLMNDDAVQRMAPLVEARAALNQRLQGSLNEAQASSLRRSVEQQGRQIHREFFWRDVQDQLKR